MNARQTTQSFEATEWRKESSPRRKPWVWMGDDGAAAQRQFFWSSDSFAPPVLGSVPVPWPTAHAVGYSRSLLRSLFSLCSPPEMRPRMLEKLIELTHHTGTRITDLHCELSPHTAYE